MRTNAFTPTFAHRSWRLLPARQRRYLLAAATSLVAPRPDRPPSSALHGLGVLGGLSNPTGLGEGARLMLRGLDRLGVTSWPLDLMAPLVGLPPPGAPLV